MSTRESMRVAKQDALQELESVNHQLDSLSRTKRALEAAVNQLSGEPREQTATGFVLHYAESNGFFQKAECSECGSTVEGYSRAWKFAPCCGSAIVRVEKETNPGDRLARTAVKDAVKSLILTGAK